MQDSETGAFGLVPSKFRVVIELSDNTIATLLGIALLMAVVAIVKSARK